MPRIDPLQLLTCLSVLLTPEGGILSRDQVPRLVNLMTKFSKKLVSKCVYVLILKSTETELVDLFMAEGGWSLIQTWLQDAVQTSNWDLVKEILGLLLVTPVDVERLKLNILPKLIKSLSRREDLEGVAQLSTQLVQRWLMIVKGTAGQIQQQVQNKEQVQSDPHSQGEAQALVLKVQNDTKPVVLNDAVITKNEKLNLKIEAVNTDPDEGINPSSFYKTSDKDGKLLIKKLPQDSKSENETTQENTENVDEKRDTKEKERNKSKTSKSTSSKSKAKEKGDTKSVKDSESEKERSKKKSSSSSSSKYKSSNSRNKDEKDRDKHSRDKGKDREKYKERDRSKDVDKEKHRSNGALKSSSNSSKSSKDRKDYRDKEKEKGKHDEKKEQVEKDSNLIEKSKSPTIDKLGRIPKKIPTTEEKTKDNSFEIRKKSFSVGIRKDKENDERPKTVKVFNSKMRSTGLEEEVKPAPPRSASTNKKPTPSIQLPTIPQKRPSPPKDIREAIVPPEKKLKMDKIDVPERPGAIKLIPPKPKPVMLLESDLFNDALTAASSKKDLKKRKRRPSVTKDNKEIVSSPTTSVHVSAEQSQISTSPQHSSSSPSLALKNIAPINFYQDTLTEESEDSQKVNEENTANDREVVENIRSPVIEAVSEVQDTPSSPPKTPTDEQDDEPLEHKKQKIDGGLKGVLLYTKKKGPKKSITWRAESDLVEVRYFELDETERVNVSRNFGDMAKMELTSEREALQMRKIIGEDVMEPLLPWRVPFPIDLEEPLAIPGSKSKEKDIQFAREKSVLPALYFDKNRIPDSPEEPIPENHQMVDPLIIPLDDPESQEIDLKSTPWPEPKGMAPYQELPQMHPQPFGNVPGSFNPPFNNLPPPAFQGIPPRFPGPVNAIGPIGHLGPGNFGPGNLNNLPNNMIGPPHMGHGSQELLNINMNPNMNLNMNPNINPNMNPNMFSGGPGPEKFRQGQDFPLYNNQTPPNNINNLNMPNHVHNNLYQHQPPQHHNNYSNHRPNRGGFRRGGQGGGGNSGNWVRVNSNSWNNKRGGGGNRGGRICKNVQIHGYCRNIDNCAFVHP